MTSLEELAVEFVCHPLLLAIVRYSKKFGGPGISWQLLDKVKCPISGNALIADNLDKDVKRQAPTEFHLLVCILNCNVILAL